MSKVIETFSSIVEHPGTPDQTIGKLVAMGWEVSEQLPEATMLRHELIPGAVRAVLHS